MTVDATGTRNPATLNPGILEARTRDVGGATGVGSPDRVDSVLRGTPVEQGAALRALDERTGDRRVSDAIARGAPEVATKPPEVCTVEVRFTPVAAGANHAFIVTTDGDSVNYFRGGPSGNGPGSSGSSGDLGSASGGSSGGSSRSGSSDGSNSSNSTSPGSGRGGPGANNGPWGPIVTDYGAYQPGTIDWTTNPSGQQTVQARTGNCDAIEGQFARSADNIERAEIPYNPLGANSNATVREILERSGIAPVNPAVWAPGWNTQLPAAR